MAATDITACTSGGHDRAFPVQHERPTSRVGTVADDRPIGSLWRKRVCHPECTADAVPPSYCSCRHRQQPTVRPRGPCRRSLRFRSLQRPSDWAGHRPRHGLIPPPTRRQHDADCRHNLAHGEGERHAGSIATRGARQPSDAGQDRRLTQTNAPQHFGRQTAHRLPDQA